MSAPRDDSAAALPEARREQVLRWLKGSIGDCTSCAKPVCRNQPRKRDGGAGFAHIDCESAMPVQVASDLESRAVAARARRSDWG